MPNTLPPSPPGSIFGISPKAYPDLPVSEYEYNGSINFTNTKAVSPIEMFSSSILKIHTKELNSYTYVLIKNICGLYFVGNRICVQTSVPCQGQLSHIMFICPSESKQKIVEFILQIIKDNNESHN